MNHTPFIYIDSLDAAEFQWFDGVTARQDTLEIIAAQIAEQEINLILSGTQVYLTTIDLPNVSFAQLQKAAPFALEEELAEDIEHLHFAYADKHNNQPVAVAVINKFFLRDCLARCQTLKIIIQACYIAPLILPLTPESWTCAITTYNALIKTDRYAGFSISTEHLANFIEMQLENSSILPKSICYYQFSEPMLRLTNPLNTIPIHHIEKTAKDFLPMLATQINKKEFGIDLLQGEFKIKYQIHQVKKAWIFAGATFALWLLFVGMGDLISYIVFTNQFACF